MTIEQLGSLAKNKYPDSPEYKGKSDREVGEFLVTKHRAYRGRREVDFTKRVEEPVVPEKKIEMPEGYRPEGVVQYTAPIGPMPAPKPEPKPEVGIAPIDVGVGITKGVASSFLGLASLPHAAGKYLAEKITGKPAPEAFQKTIRQKVEETGALEAKGMWEKIGKGGEQLAEFFAPTPVGKSKAVSKGIDIINKLKKPASVTRVAEKVAPVVSRAVREGAKFGGVVAVQEGEVGKEAKEAAAIGAAFPVVGALTRAGVSKAIAPFKKLIKDIPEKAWESILKRSPAEIQKAPTLAKDIAKLKIVGKSREEIYGELSNRIMESNKLIDKMLATRKGVKVPYQDSPIVITKYANPQVMAKNLEKLKEAYAKIPGEAASVNAVEKIIVDIRGKTAMTAPMAQELKKQLYKMTSSSYTKGFLEIPAKKESQKMLAKEIKKQLEILAPGVKNENAREGILIGSRDAIEKAMGRAESKSPIGLTDILAGGMYLSGGGPGGIFAAIGLHAAKHPLTLSGISKVVTHFETLPPLKQAYYYETLKGLTAGYEMFTRD